MSDASGNRVKNNSTATYHAALVPLLLDALENANVGVTLQGLDSSYKTIVNLPSYFEFQVPSKATDETLFGTRNAEKLTEVKEKVLNDGNMRTVTLVIDGNHETHFCECTVRRYTLNDGTGALLTTFADQTNHKKREETLKALLREVSHRSRNLLAIVQSIAMQTAGSSGSLDRFLINFRTRIASLATSQDIVTDSNWSGAYLFDLAERQIQRYLMEEKVRSCISIEGDNVHLKPNAAIHIGLALHELIANSAAYGCLSALDGEIKLCNSVQKTRNGIENTLIWQERLGESVRRQEETVTRSFGSAVLQRVVPASLSGKADYRIERDQVLYRLDFSVN